MCGILSTLILLGTLLFVWQVGLNEADMDELVFGRLRLPLVPYHFGDLTIEQQAQYASIYVKTNVLMEYISFTKQRMTPDNIYRYSVFYPDRCFDSLTIPNLAYVVLHSKYSYQFKAKYARSFDNWKAVCHHCGNRAGHTNAFDYWKCECR